MTRPEDMARRITVKLRRLLQLNVPPARENRLNPGEFVIVGIR
jgi:hypothetical protein